MKLSADDQKKAIAVAAFLVVGAVILYFEVRDTSPPAPVPVSAPVVRQSGPTPGAAKGGAAKTSTASTQLDPTLKMGPMLMTEALVYSGGGRNIFSATSVPVDIPKPIAPPRPKPVAPVQVAPAGPPPPPPIDLKFFGTAMSKNGTRQALLLHGDDVFLALAGDVVERRYRVISIAANSILIEDMANNNRQTLPLLAN